MDSVSIIISARNEFPNIVHTINNLMLDCWNSGIKYEFILADNGSEDNTSWFWKHAWNNAQGKHTNLQVLNEFKPSPRGIVTEGKVRFVYDPVYSNVGARHKAVKYAKYKNIIFADAHIAVRPGSIKYMLETLHKYKGVVHSPVAWMGASVDNPKPGVQYSYKIGEKIWGTWNYAMSSPDHPFYIPVSGHCFIAVDKEEYLSYGGYDDNQRVYGGGENYLDTLYWMMGSNVMVDPRALVFHLSAGRGYAYDMHSLIHNMFLTSYVLGGHKWSERIFVTYLDKPGTHELALIELYMQAITEGEERRKWVEEHKKYTLEEVLAIDKEHDCDGHCHKNQKHAMRIWDTKNEELVGKHISFVVVFEDWLTRLHTDRAKRFIASSPHQSP